MSTSGPDLSKDCKPAQITVGDSRTSKEMVPRAVEKNNKPSVSSSKSEKPVKFHQVSFKPLSPTVVQVLVL